MTIVFVKTQPTIYVFEYGSIEGTLISLSNKNSEIYTKLNIFKFATMSFTMNKVHIITIVGIIIKLTSCTPDFATRILEVMHK